MGTCTSSGTSGAIDADRVSAVASCTAGRLEACLPVSSAMFKTVRQICGLWSQTMCDYAMPLGAELTVV